jgi:hypothetical protein
MGWGNVMLNTQLLRYTVFAETFAVLPAMGGAVAFR